MSTSAIPGIRFNHVSISVADLDAQVAWYQQALGFAEVVEQYELPEPPVRTAVLQAAPGIRIELIERGGSGRAGEYSDPLDMTRSQGYGHWAVDVDDLDAAFRWLLGAGATEVWAPADAVAPGARFAYVKDPEGNLIELIQPAR
jgi:catechol 2,3-dioxygenase-like lactoylglutathione lyase family enzyme